MRFTFDRFEFHSWSRLMNSTLGVALHDPLLHSTRSFPELFLSVCRALWKRTRSEVKNVMNLSSLHLVPCHARLMQNLLSLACENIRFSSLFIAGDVSQGGKSATLRQKFHTNDANQCLNDKFGCHGVPNINLSNFTCLVVDFGKVLCSTSSSNRLKCFF